MKLIAATCAALILTTGLASAADDSEENCPDYRLDGYRVVQVCDPDKFAEGDFLSPTEFAQGSGGSLTSVGGSDDSSDSSN